MHSIMKQLECLTKFDLNWKCVWSICNKLPNALIMSLCLCVCAISLDTNITSKLKYRIGECVRANIIIIFVRLMDLAMCWWAIVCLFRVVRMCSSCTRSSQSHHRRALYLRACTRAFDTFQLWLHSLAISYFTLFNSLLLGPYLLKILKSPLASYDRVIIALRFVPHPIDHYDPARSLTFMHNGFYSQRIFSLSTFISNVSLYLHSQTCLLLSF